MSRAFQLKCNEGSCKDDEGPSGKDYEQLRLKDHQWKGRGDKFKDSAHRKDDVRIHKKGTPEDRHIFQVRYNFTHEPHKSPMTLIY